MIFKVCTIRRILYRERQWQQLRLLLLHGLRRLLRGLQRPLLHFQHPNLKQPNPLLQQVLDQILVQVTRQSLAPQAVVLWARILPQTTLLRTVDLRMLLHRTIRLQVTHLRAIHLRAIHLRVIHLRVAHLQAIHLQEIHLRATHLRGVPLLMILLRAIRLQATPLQAALHRPAVLPRAALRLEIHQAVERVLEVILRVERRQMVALAILLETNRQVLAPLLLQSWVILPLVEVPSVGLLDILLVEPALVAGLRAGGIHLVRNLLVKLRQVLAAPVAAPKAVEIHLVRNPLDKLRQVMVVPVAVRLEIPLKGLRAPLARKVRAQGAALKGAPILVLLVAALSLER